MIEEEQKVIDNAKHQIKYNGKTCERYIGDLLDSEEPTTMRRGSFGLPEFDGLAQISQFCLITKVREAVNEAVNCSVEENSELVIESLGYFKAKEIRNKEHRNTLAEDRYDTESLESEEVMSLSKESLKRIRNKLKKDIKFTNNILSLHLKAFKTKKYLFLEKDAKYIQNLINEHAFDEIK